MTIVDSDALAPVRAALLRRATVEAERECTEAQRQADAAVAGARERARSILDDAAAQGRADAEALLALERTRARQAAREVELRAQREAYEELRRRVGEEVARLRSSPGLRQRLAARVRTVLGPGAEVRDAPDGGVIGQAGSRRLDLSLHAVAARAVEELGADVPRLWAP